MLDHMITVRGESVDKAIEKGLKELGISRQDADIHIISEGKKGLFGFGKQDAIVEIVQQTNLSYKELTQQLEEETAQTQEVTQDQEQDVSFGEVAQSQEPDSAKRIAQESQANTYLHEEPDQEEQEFSQEPSPQDTADTLPNAAQVQAGGARQESDFEDLDIETEESDDEDDDEEIYDKQEEGLSLEESSQKVAKYIDRVIKEYGAHSDTEFELNGNQVTFNIDTDKSGLVIGKHGKIINSLQVLSQTLLQSYYRQRVSVLLNVGDYRDRRANVLEQIAERTAEEVNRTRQTVILDPLPAYERKQIHAHLSKYDYIKTHSEGKEPNRYLVVEYK